MGITNPFVLLLTVTPLLTSGNESPNCMINGNACPLPLSWLESPDWSLINSTALMATNSSGFYPQRQWGFVTLDWQCNAENWIKPTVDGCECEKVNAANCLQLKQTGKVKRCSIYHNMELSLEWLESERAVMDAQHVEAGWFLRFKNNGSVYNHPRQYRPGVGPMMNQWYIDWRNPEAALYFISAIVNSTLLPGVDSTFTDDVTGVPNEHPEVVTDLNLSTAEVENLQLATQNAGQRLANALAAVNRTCWNCVGGVESPPGGNWGLNQRPPPPDSINCSNVMRHLCQPSMQERGMFMSWDNGWNETNVTLHHNQTMASFLITRPPVAFIGNSYGLNDNTWSSLFALDVGEPLELCRESPAGVFSRKWSKGYAALNCNTYQAELNFQQIGQE